MYGSQVEKLTYKLLRVLKFCLQSGMNPLHKKLLEKLEELQLKMKIEVIEKILLNNVVEMKVSKMNCEVFRFR